MARKDIITRKSSEDCDICINYSPHSKEGSLYIKVNDSFKKMHEYLYEVNIGCIPPDKILIQKCENKRCMNLNHMELKTPSKPVSELEKRYINEIKSAKKRKLKFELSLEEFIKLKSMPCVYCNYNGPNGIDRIDSSKGYLITNSVSCCKYCNKSKMTYNLEEWLKWRNETYKYKITYQDVLNKRLYQK